MVNAFYVQSICGEIYVNSDIIISNSNKIATSLIRVLGTAKLNLKAGNNLLNNSKPFEDVLIWFLIRICYFPCPGKIDTKVILSVPIKYTPSRK